MRYPYNQRYRVYLKGKKRETKSMISLSSERRDTRQFYVQVYVESGEKQSGDTRADCLPLSSRHQDRFSLITKHQGWRTSIVRVFVAARVRVRVRTRNTFHK